MSQKRTLHHGSLIFSLVVAYLSLLAYHHLGREESATRLSLAKISQDVPASVPSRTPDSFRSESSPTVEASDPVWMPKRTDRPNLAPRWLSASDRYRYYQRMAEVNGLPVRGVTVLGFRGVAPNGTRHSAFDNSTPYDDTFVVLRPEEQSVIELLGSTHAGQAQSPGSPFGVAQILPGQYRAEPCGDWCGMAAWLVTDLGGENLLPCLRDSNGDGFINLEERGEIYLATDILFHNGCHPLVGASVGCQVLPPDLMEEFIAAVGPQNGFDYLLLDAD